MVVEAMDSMYLENLDEFINDEGKIVTYKWLSLSLGVDSNVAKQMLFHFITKQRDLDKGDNLNVTYLVSGVEAGKDGQPDMHRVMLVREENLTTAKSKLKDLISVHVYSVQKTKLPDMSVLYTADYDKIKENILSINKYSGIECQGAKVRSSADLEKLQMQNAYQAPPEPTRIPSKYKPNQTKSSPKKESPGDNKLGSNKASGKGNQIASMFARQTKKVDEQKDDDKAKKQEGKDTTKTPSSAGAKKKGGISSFFSKAPPAKKTEESKSSESSPVTTDSPALSSIKSEVESPVKTESTVSSPVKTESQDSIKEDSEQMEVDSPPKKARKKSQSKIKPTKTTQRGKSKRVDDSEEPVPKRKRIMQMIDSESSEDEENEGEDENPFPPSPPPEPSRIESDSEEDIPPTPQPESKVDLLKGEKKGKRKKLVDKTFMDEDGFFVTKKEYEYVSDSDEEEPLPVKDIVSPQKKTSPTTNTASPKKVDTKQASPAKKKQANIMNFFKKK